MEWARKAGGGSLLSPYLLEQGDLVTVIGRSTKRRCFSSWLANRIVPACLTRPDAGTPVLLHHQCPGAVPLSQDLLPEQVLSVLRFVLETLRSLSACDIRFFILMRHAGEIPAAVTHNSLALVSTLSSVALLSLCNLGTQVHLMLTQPSSRTKASSVKRESGKYLSVS